MELQDAAGGVVASHRLVSQPTDEGDSNLETVLMLMPDAENVAAVLVQNPARQTVASRTASQQAPLVELAGDPVHDPALSQLHLEIQMSDPDGDPVTAPMSPCRPGLILCEMTFQLSIGNSAGRWETGVISTES